MPYNGDPDRVAPVEGAKRATAAVRAAGLATAVVTNQSGIARGIVSREQVDAVNDRVQDLLGPFDVWEVCPHGPDEQCDCRKPQPGMIVHAAKRLGVEPRDVVVIGDIGADVEAARAAGAASILVPTEVTRVEEVEAAEIVADNLVDAVALVLHAVRAPVGR